MTSISAPTVRTGWRSAPSPTNRVCAWATIQRTSPLLRRMRYSRLYRPSPVPVVRGSHRRVERFAVVRMDLCVERGNPRLEVRRQAVDMAELLGPVHPVVDVVVIEDTDADDARREIELRLAPDQAFLGLLARRCIERNADEPRGAPGGVVQEAAARLDPHDVARVGLDDSILAAEQRAFRFGSVELGEHALAVFRVQA